MRRIMVIRTDKLTYILNAMGRVGSIPTWLQNIMLWHYYGGEQL